MAPALFTLTALLILHSSWASQQYPERNPALQEYQNQSPVFPLKEDWYLLYRNFRIDPLFGGAEKCLRFAEAEPGVNGTYPVFVRYTPSHSIAITATPSSTIGYNLHNAADFGPRGFDMLSATAYSAYTDAEKCEVLRLPYAGANACGLFVPKSQLGSTATCCHFIFDLLCGTQDKYMVYDPSCP
ncbi:uncharacterized protein LOC8033887 [Ixodes scapularis]|uniref:uncharacterized protein LOC8033887 n=1 Tax=Ixodes scapularis TaxID=6945 RepID=UPI001A9EC864|nr:uncharacterized protein LOC8033887 [Ixodes scapularis]